MENTRRFRRKIIETLQAEISDGDLNEQEAFDKSLGATFKGDYTYFNRGIAKMQRTGSC